MHVILCLFQFEHTGKTIKSLEADVLNNAHKLLLRSMAAMYNNYCVIVMLNNTLVIVIIL